MNGRIIMKNQGGNFWHLKKFEELSLNELYGFLQLRIKTFVIEQQSFYNDLDGLDLKALHLWCVDEKNTIFSYARLIPPKIKFQEASFGRVLVNECDRGNGYGKKMIEKILEVMSALYPNFSIKIQAQSYLKKFYESFGFFVISDEYLEDGVAHIDMYKENR